MRKLGEKQKAKMVFRKIFSVPLEKGDFVKFKHGQKFWKVTWVSERAYAISSIPHRAGRIMGKNDERIFKVPKEDFLRWLVRNSPSDLTRYYLDLEEVDLKKFFRKRIPPSDFVKDEKL